MTEQEMFDKAYLGLASQGFQRSVSYEWGCAYRNPDGLKCAIGWCVPDDKYRPNLEGCSARNSRIQTLFPDVSQDFMFELQCVHDDSDSGDDMRSELEAFARVHKLTVPEIR